jgi:uncharacterized tellurite resistance protein B-like protein
MDWNKIIVFAVIIFLYYIVQLIFHKLKNYYLYKKITNVYEKKSLLIKIGMAIAMADGKLDDTEGEALKSWIKENIDLFPDKEREVLKKTYNDTLKESYRMAMSGNLNLNHICKEINKSGEYSHRHDALELAYKIMIADGAMHNEEIKTFNKIANIFNIDKNELENIRDKYTVEFNHKSSDLDLEQFLSIDPSLSNDEIKEQLRKEFQKWNNRLSSLPEGKERDSAQNMLDLVSKAREKYE